MPDLVLNLKKITDLKYGDNPEQRSYGLFRIEDGPFVSPDPFQDFVQLEGGLLGETNVREIDNGISVLRCLARSLHKNFGSNPFLACGLKHSNPCGGAVGTDRLEVLKEMIEGDPDNIFGGTVVTNFEIGEAEANLLRSHLSVGGPRILSVVMAPQITKKALSLLKPKQSQCAMLQNHHLGGATLRTLGKGVRISSALNGIVISDPPSFMLDLSADYLVWESHENAQWSDQAKIDLILAWSIGSRSWSNTITFAKNNRIVANGIGQTSRVDSMRVALMKADGLSSGCVAYSDSFYPFSDGPKFAVAAGITHAFTSSGSVRDQEVFQVFRDANVALCTGPDKIVRGFRH